MDKGETLSEIYARFPKREDCIARIEDVFWHGVPECPYCFSKRSTEEKANHRRHCNNCNTAFSVTVNTIFHKTKLPLQKWFFAISLLTEKKLSAKQLQNELQTTYKTAWYVSLRIRRGLTENNDSNLKRLLE